MSFSLKWSAEASGSVECWTPTFYPPDGSSPVDGYVFPADPTPRVSYDYGVPDFRAIESYLKARRRYVEEATGIPDGPTVTVRFDREVPWQAVVNMIDIFLRVGISDFALGAPEVGE